MVSVWSEQCNTGTRIVAVERDLTHVFHFFKLFNI